MDFDEYRKRGKEMIDYIADYLENIRDRRVFPDVKPGYMRTMLPDSAPLEGEDWNSIFGDIERVIMPGVTHWQSPHMHAYFPALNSFPSLLGDMLADAINCLGFTWASSPACTELETVVMNWLGKMIGLPDEFLHLNRDSNGGGVIQTTASESTLVCLLAGRTQAIRLFHEHTPGFQDSEINARLVAYCSDQAHSSVEKAALIGLVRMRYIEADENLILRGASLREAIQDDIKLGLIPFWVCATLGTTGACAFDNLEEVGPICQEFKLWLHVDAAYAGSAFICPEHRVWLKGIERADSIAFNPSKWLMVHFDCTAMWVRNSGALHRTFNVEPLYLQHENSGLAIDYMHWQIPLSKRFRSLKLWFVIRNYGIKGLQQHIREGVRLAQKFEALLLSDHRFEIPAPRYLGMVVFRIKGDNALTERLLKRLNHRGNLHCVPASLKGKYVIRFTVTSSRTTNDDIIKDWTEIRHVTTEVLEEMKVKISADRAKVPLKETREKNEAFGSSLLLANTPMSPKIVNGSFAAIFDADEFLAKAYAGIRVANEDSPSMRRRVRGILMSGKQFSLDSRMDLVVHGIAPQMKGDKSADHKNRPIREDSEDTWEASESCHTNRINVRSRRSMDKHRLILPLQPSCEQIPPPSIRPPQKKHHPYHHPQQLLQCRSQTLSSSFYSSLSSICEDEVMEPSLTTSTRVSKHISEPIYLSPLSANVPTENRPTKSHSSCSFTNEGFEANLHFRDLQPKLFAKRINLNHTKSFSDFSFDDAIDWPRIKSSRANEARRQYRNKPKITVCLSDESAIDFDSNVGQSSSFGGTFEFPVLPPKDDMDAWHVIRQKTDMNMCVHNDRCTKCGHKAIPIQQTSSFK